MAKKKVHIQLNVTGKEEADFINMGIAGTEEFLKNILPKASKAGKFFSSISNAIAISFKEQDEVEEVDFEEVE